MRKPDPVPPECRSMKLLTIPERMWVRSLWERGVFSKRQIVTVELVRDGDQIVIQDRPE